MFAFLMFIVAARLASAVPLLPPYPFSTPANTTDAPQQLLISGSGYIWSAEFNGTAITLQSNVTQPGAAPSWLLARSPTSFVANDENSEAVSVFSLNSTTGGMAQERSYRGSAAGVVHLAFNKDRTRMVGSGYSRPGHIDVWDTSAADGSMSLLKTVPTGFNDSRVHEAVLDPSGRYFAVNDLGRDLVHVLDAANDSFAITSTAQLAAGCGPRHGAFHPSRGGRGAAARHYLVVCETGRALAMLDVRHPPGGGAVSMALAQTLASYSAGRPPANAAAAAPAELLLRGRPGGAADVYVSNRLTGNATDTIAHFRLRAPRPLGARPGPLLALVDQISSAGTVPRGMSLSPDGGFLFVGNQGGLAGAAVAVFARDRTSGALDPEPVATVPHDVFGAGAAGFGPQFVAPVPAAAAVATSPPRPSGT